MTSDKGPFVDDDNPLQDMMDNPFDTNTDLTVEDPFAQDLVENNAALRHNPSVAGQEDNGNYAFQEERDSFSSSAQRGGGYEIDDPNAADDMFAGLNAVLPDPSITDSDSLDFDDNEEDKVRFLPILIGVGMIILFGGLVYFGFSTNLLNDLMYDDPAIANGQPPIIRAPTDPIRRRPQDPGGLFVPGQESEVLNPGTRQTETILSSKESEQPMSLEELVEQREVSQKFNRSEQEIPSLFGEGPTGDLQPTSPVKTIPPAVVPKTEKLPVNNKTTTRRESLLASSTPTTNSVDDRSYTNKTETRAAISAVPPLPRPVIPSDTVLSKQPSPVKMAPSTATQNVTTSRNGSGGPWRIQLASMRSEAAAQQFWQRAQNRAGVLLEALELRVQRADLGQRGTFYRVQAGTFQLDQAQKLCQSLQKRGQDCIIVR